MKKNYSPWLYAIYGFFLGSLFPIAATYLKLRELGIPLTSITLLAIHLSDPAMMIIDSTPIIMAITFLLIGFQSIRFQDTARKLSKSRETLQEQFAYEHLFLEALIDSTSFAIVRLDRNHLIITCNEAFEDLFGYTCDEIIGEHLDDMIASDDLKEEASRVSATVSQGNLTRLVSKRKRKDGSLVDVEIVGVPVTVGGKRIGILGLYHDISPRIAAERALRESESRFKSLFNESPISLWEEDFSQVKIYLDRLGNKKTILEKLETDPEVLQNCIKLVKILDINQATVDLYNARNKDELLTGLSHILVDDSNASVMNEIAALVNGETSFDCEILQRKLNGELIHGWLRMSLPQEYRKTWEKVYFSIMDITERKQIEEKMRYMSFHDALTGLYNRAYFEEELQRLSDSRQFPVSIIACDLDNLKIINDQYGHDAGDRALKAAAKILGTGTFRKEDVVARTGGDEFTIIVPAVDINNNPQIIERIEKGVNRHNTSIVEDGLFRPISISVGYAVVQQGESLMEGYKKADAAMYKVKMARKEESNPSI